MLKICNDTLSEQRRGLDNIKHLLVVVLQQSQFEPVFCGIERDGTRAGGTIETVNGLALDACQVNRVIQSADNAMIPRNSNLIEWKKKASNMERTLEPSSI